MLRMSGSVTKIDEGEEDEDVEESEIRWSDLIFLPFHPVFKFFVLCTVILKSTLGPMEAVYSILHCTNVMEYCVFLSYIKYFYSYFCDLIYFLDTFFHIVHRKLTDKAMRREHLPKSAFLLLVDVMSLIPFYALATYETCPPVQLWPNILAFSEFIVIYRVMEYFSLATTHSFWKLTIGFTIVLVICINCVSCFLLLLTMHGLCDNCSKGVYDWRKYIQFKINESDPRFTTYIYANSFVLSLTIDALLDDTKPTTILEYILVTIFMIAGYLLYVYIVIPKLFSESLISLRRICIFHPRAKKLVDETKRRNPSPYAYIKVTKFYNFMWKERTGITHIPEIINELPRSLRIDIRQDLVWPVFYHSITLRKTSMPFQRWLCEFIRLDYKLPGEKFFTGPYYTSNMYYVKSGTVELISADDGITPLLLLSGGTVFGDISFHVPPLKRNLIVRCVTYCEIYILSRCDILKAMQKYPVDRHNILSSAKDRIKHARTLYTCKQHVRGLDRTEDEGIAWLKRRWWELSDAVGKWNKMTGNDKMKRQLPPEEAVYHCAKYIGLLVLCGDLHLQKKSIFVNVKFPWVLTADSPLIRVWDAIVLFTVFVVLITYPPSVRLTVMPPWFTFIQRCVDFVYCADILISISTTSRNDNVPQNFASVLLARCRNITFILDILATIWIESMAVIVGLGQFYEVCQLNRLIKIYLLFNSEYVKQWNIKTEPLFNLLYTNVLSIFCYNYLTAYAVYIMCKYIPKINKSYFFGETNWISNSTEQTSGELENSIFGIPIAFIFEVLFIEYSPEHLIDIYLAIIVHTIGFYVYAVCKSRLVSYLYLRDREKTNFQTFVSNTKEYYKQHRIHRALLKRLDMYLNCHWKYYKGMDILYPIKLQDEPFDIYWKVHGEVAEKIIGESKAFAGADPALVRELGYAAKVAILPQNATLFLFGVQCQNVSWIINGCIQCEYPDEQSQTQTIYYNSGEIIPECSVLLKKPAFRTYIAFSECEILYIKIQDFINIIKRYPYEMSYFQNCTKELEPEFEELFQAYSKKHEEYQKNLRYNIFQARRSVESKKSIDMRNMRALVSHKTGDILIPDSNFMYYWMMIRSISVIISILSASFQGGSGALIRCPLIIISTTCDCISCIDIVLKMFMAYYDGRGILIRETKMCIIHYLTRSFFLDIIGIVPWYLIVKYIMTKEISQDDQMFMNTVCKFAHLYIVTNFLDYIADSPNIISNYVLIFKWQLVAVLVMIGGSSYLMSHCVNFTFDDSGALLNMRRGNGCWIPTYLNLSEELTEYELHLVFAASFNMAQGGLVRMILGTFHIDRNNLGVGLMLLAIGVLFWYVTCYCLTLMVLCSRKDTLFQYRVNQLQKFLTAERVEQGLVKKALAHFSYWWARTKGINVHNFMGERIGVVFRQDLSYYFYEETLSALNTMLGGEESIGRQLSSASFQHYFRSDEQVMREMDIVPYVYIVHRGRVMISKDGLKLADLTKGAIFGPMNSNSPRPVLVSAQTSTYADILQISITQFQDIINDKVRHNIADNPQSKNDYMTLKHPIKENPYNTIEYILRGRKTIQLPWMHTPFEARQGNWYGKWLFVSWLMAPFLSVTIVLIVGILPDDIRTTVLAISLVFDAIHFAHIISEFYTVDLIEVKGTLVKRRLGGHLLKNWRFYVDVISLLIPLITIASSHWSYELARLLRLRLLYEYNVQFCNRFKSSVTPVIMKFVIVFLILHALICGWMYVACQDSVFPVKILDLPDVINETIDYDEWAHPRSRRRGCFRLTKSFKSEKSELKYVSFLVPRKWQNDYIVALIYIVLLHTHSAMNIIVPLNVKQTYYKVFVNFVVHFVDVWIMSVAVSAVYTKYRELNQYDYNVKNLTMFLRFSGLSPVLLDTIRAYTSHLWKRQRGNWLPELVHQAPTCLREDLFSTLYIHHLKRPSIFKDLPDYFTRQLVTKLQRVVLFPGKTIIQEGDIYPCSYFIHEGEVEKWYTDQSGEKKMMCLLTTNNYFGIIPAFFSTPFQFSYYTQTVVDLIYLKFSSWQDLLNAYPDIKKDLFEAANKVKKEQSKGNFKHIF